MESFHDKLYAIISETLGVEKEKIEHTAHFAEDLNAGDLEMEELSSQIEEKIGVKISPAELTGVGSVSDLEETVADKIEGLIDVHEV